MSARPQSRRDRIAIGLASMFQDWRTDDVLVAVGMVAFLMWAAFIGDPFSH